MRTMGLMLLLAAAMALSGCSSKFKTYNGPEVTRVIVDKSDRRMHLLHHQKVLKSYDVGLGFAPDGHKQFEGDGRTPEGEYTIDRRNPNSKYYLSIGIDYPRTEDVSRAASLGLSPGGDIFIHGFPNGGLKPGARDWTAGCIAVTDRDMRDIYAMVNDGTPILIMP